mmetsp:Transcript_168784/g.542473  ORF Transcript_168784/g.542473 Transcript_168784/m.542473 type:complete len:245 (+) Transcript_168784:1721-2455(+)
MADLFCPSDHGAFEHMHSVFRRNQVAPSTPGTPRCTTTRQRVARWLRQHRLALRQSASNLQLCEEHVVLVHDIFSNQLRPGALVRGVHQCRRIDRVAIDIERLQNVLRQFEEHSLILDIVLREVDLRCEAVHDNDFLVHLFFGGKLGAAGGCRLAIGVKKTETKLGVLEKLAHSTGAAALLCHGCRHVLLHLLRTLEEEGAEALQHIRHAGVPSSLLLAALIATHCCNKAAAPSSGWDALLWWR